MRRLVATLPLAVALAGCGSFNEQFGGGTFWISPGKYQYFSCLQMLDYAAIYAQRQKRLEDLMARASQGPGGHAIGQFVYRTEYQQATGEREALAAEMTAKRCQVEGTSTSGRSVF